MALAALGPSRVSIRAWCPLSPMSCWLYRDTVSASSILLPHTSLAEATQVTDRLRATIPRIAIPDGPVSPVPSGVTVSMGVAASAGAKRDLVDFLAAADRALYQAKNAGRDLVHIISDEADSGPFPRLAARP